MMAAQHYAPQLKSCITEITEDADDEAGDSPSRRFRVSLGLGRKGKGKKTSVVVDDTFHCGSSNARDDLHGRPIYAGTPTDKSALWPLVLEKAIAVMFSDLADSSDAPSYDFIDAGDTAQGKLRGEGHAGRIVRMVAGREYVLDDKFGVGFRKLWRDARDALAENRGVCVGTVEKTKIKLDRLYGNHQYLVLGAGEVGEGKGEDEGGEGKGEGGEPYLKLFNPHNRNDGGSSTVVDLLRVPTKQLKDVSKDADARMFLVYEEEFLQYFKIISTCDA